MKKTVLFSSLLWALLSFGMAAQELDEATRKKHFELEDGIGLQGYDPVSYFTEKEPKKGSKKIEATYKSVTYRFASEANKATFLADPAKYEPAYGGWCAYAFAANGNKMQPDAETYKISDGKLYLFYNSFFNNTLPKWNEDEANMKKKANEVWQKILTEK